MPKIANRTRESEKMAQTTDIKTDANTMQNNK